MPHAKKAISLSNQTIKRATNNATKAIKEAASERVQLFFYSSASITNTPRTKYMPA